MSSVKVLAHVPEKRTFEFITADTSGKLLVSDATKAGAANNWLSLVDVSPNTYSAAFHCNGYGRESFISISDLNLTNTSDSWALFGSVDGTAYVYIGLLPRVKVGNIGMHATSKVNLALFSYVKLLNTSATDTFNGVSATVLSS